MKRWVVLCLLACACGSSDNNRKPTGTGGGGALQLANQDGEPSSDRMFFNVISTIAPCWGPLTVKDTGVVTVRNGSGVHGDEPPVDISSIEATGAFTATPAFPVPLTLAPGQSVDVTVKFVAVDGRVHNGTLTVRSNAATTPTRTMNLAGFRQDLPQNTHEPTFEELVNGLYGYTTVVGTPEQLFAAGGYRVAVGDEVLSSYWVKANPSQPVSVQLLSAWHSGWDCGDAGAVSYGSSAYWFPKGRTSEADDHYILGGAKEDIQRLLPRRYENPSQQATGSFDPGSQQFGWHIELEFSDESMAEQEPWCTASEVCGHRMRFWPLKDASGAVVPNTWLISLDMHRAPSPGVPFFAMYDYNDETYLVRNMKPAPP
ncbi:MAG TPA: hypothetical protein VFD38_04040 [Myxococcaceae bacterium]|nr:hypothetical protein [Myxococcaceae bacterium]